MSIWTIKEYGGDIPYSLAVPVCPLCANDPFVGHKPRCIIGIAIALTKPEEDTP